MRDPGYGIAYRLVFGLFIICLGVVFTLDNLGLVRAGEILRWWPGFLVVIGLMRLMGLGCRQSLWRGLVYLIAGGWLLLHAAGLVSLNPWHLWPVLLIVLGISMIRGGSTVWRVGYVRRGDGGVLGAVGERVGERVRERVRERMREREATGAAGDAGPVADAGASAAGSRAPSDSGEDASARFTLDVFLSNITRKVTSQALTRGNVVVLLGGADVDLKSARLATDQAAVEVHLVMGGLNLVIPEDWVVEYEGTQFMGSVEDHTRRPAGTPRGRLVINGVVLLSSVVIKN